MDTGMVACIMVFGIPLAAILTSHHRKIMEMKLRMKSGVDSGVSAEISGLRQQLAELRDTTTKYDISFDSALDRLEMRVGALERNSQGAALGASTVSANGGR